MVSNKRSQIAEGLLALATDDVIYARDVWNHGRRKSGTTDRECLRSLALGVISELITKRWVVAGDMLKDGTHLPWECSPSEAVERITDRWLQWGAEPPTPGAIVWLKATAGGRAVGLEVLGQQ